ncbi:MAG: hypothetical protein ABSF23_18430 [Terracidiphilus sp.]|jgi:hypothetical protein
MKNAAVAGIAATVLCFMFVPIRTDRQLRLPRTNGQVDFSIYHLDVLGSLAAKIYNSKAPGQFDEVLRYIVDNEPGLGSGLMRDVESVNKTFATFFDLYPRPYELASTVDLKDTTAVQGVVIPGLWVLFAVIAYLLCRTITSASRLTKYIVAGSAVAAFGVLFFFADVEANASWAELVVEHKTTCGVVFIALGLLCAAMGGLLARSERDRVTSILP